MASLTTVPFTAPSCCYASKGSLVTNGKHLIGYQETTQANSYYRKLAKLLVKGDYSGKEYILELQEKFDKLGWDFPVEMDTEHQYQPGNEQSVVLYALAGDGCEDSDGDFIRLFLKEVALKYTIQRIEEVCTP